MLKIVFGSLSPLCDHTCPIRKAMKTKGAADYVELAPSIRSFGEFLARLTGVTARALIAPMSRGAVCQVWSRT